MSGLRGYPHRYRAARLCGAVSLPQGIPALTRYTRSALPQGRLHPKQVTHDGSAFAAAASSHAPFGHGEQGLIPTMEFYFDPDRTIIGTGFTGAGEELIALSERDRLSHVLCIGRTGRGKTTILTNIAVQDIYAGRGISVIDPHGDMSRELLEHLPSFRARDLVYIDPSDEERVVTINSVACVPRNRIPFVVSSVVGAFKGVYGDFWGYRMERILSNVVAALVEAPNTSLIGLPNLLKSESYRHQVLADVEDPMVRDFFATEFEVWRDSYRVEVIEPVLNKVEQLFGFPVSARYLWLYVKLYGLHRRHGQSQNYGRQSLQRSARWDAREIARGDADLRICQRGDGACRHRHEGGGARGPCAALPDRG